MNRTNLHEKKTYYVEKRAGWFNGEYDHVVRIRDHGDAILCASAKHCCELVANSMNLIEKMKDK